MHELSLSESLIDLVVEAARRECMAQVTRVVLEIGAAASVDPDALRFCFPIAAEHTMAAGAELVIEMIALQARCDSCRITYAPEVFYAPCPGCGGFGGKVIAGRDMRVASFHGA